MPPVENLGSGLWSIPVPIPDNPLRYVLVYAFERPDGAKYGAVNKDVNCRHCAKDGAFGGYPAPLL